MKKPANAFLGIDLGASSGRAILGLLRNYRLELKEVYRFPNHPVEIEGTLYWDFPALWRHVTAALETCSQAGYARLSGIGVDTWGVDFGLLDADGKLLGNPVHYRDRRTEGVEQKIDRNYSSKELYRLSGQRAGRISTLAQLVAMRNGRAAPLPDHAESLLMIPDIFRYFLSGKIACELTSAGSSQLLNIRTGRWAQSLFRTFHFPVRCMPGLIAPATVVGPLQKTLCKQCGIRSAPVIAVAGHDTACAVAAMPEQDANTVFISSGTWSMIGIRRSRPVLSNDACRLRFVHMIGFHSILFMKGIMGLYLLENLLRSWRRHAHDLTYRQMIQMASDAEPFRFHIDVNSPILFSAGENVEEQITTFLRRTGQKDSPGRNELVRSLLEGLAFASRQVVRDLEQIIGQINRRICMFGGGSQNALLCQFTANATGLEIMAGPAEATVIGNLAIQALATGHLKHPTEIPALVARSFGQILYKPCATEEWDRQFKRHRQITTAMKES